MKTNILIIVVAIAAAVMTASAQTPAPKAALTKTELRKLIEDTEWVSPKRPGSPQERTFIFRKDGEIMDSSLGGKYRFYVLEAPDILKIYHGNPKRNRNAEFVFLRVNAAAMTAQQDITASTIGGEMFLKFVGPAKPPK